MRLNHPELVHKHPAKNVDREGSAQSNNPELM